MLFNSAISTSTSKKRTFQKHPRNTKVVLLVAGTPQKLNIALENRPFQKDLAFFQPSIFRCTLAVSFR